MQKRRRLRLIISLLLLVPGLLALQTFFAWPGHTPIASAHAFVIGSEPVDSSTIPVAPKSIRIFFDTEISPASHADVISPNGQLVQGGPSYIPANNPRELDTPLLPASQLPEGGYLVRWTAISMKDGHATHGPIGFNLGHSSTGLSGQANLGPTTSNTLPELNLFGGLSIAWDWLIAIALTFWVGTLITEGLILTYVGEASNVLNQVRKQVRSLQWLSLVAIMVGECIAFFLRAAQLNHLRGSSVIEPQSFIDLFSSTTYGILWLTRLVLVVLAMFFLARTTLQQKHNEATANAKAPIRAGKMGNKTTKNFSQLRRQLTQEQRLNEKPTTTELETASLRVRQRGYTTIWLILTSTLLLTYALSSDAAQLAQPNISAIVLDWLYLAAQSVWFGTVAYMGYILLPTLTSIEPDHHAATLVALMRRVHPMLLATLGIILVTGLYLGETSIQTLQQFLDEPYGRTLLVKIGLLLFMLISTLYTLFALRPRLTRQTILLPVVNSEMPARRARQSAIGHTEQSIKRHFTLLSWLGAAALFCNALMTFFAPPIVFPNVNYNALGYNIQGAISTPSTSTSTSTPSQTQALGNLSVTLLLLPGRANHNNNVILSLLDQNGVAVTDARVTFSTDMQIMDMGTTSASAKQASDLYIGSFARGQGFSMAGIWNIQVTIRLPHKPLLHTTFQVSVND